MIFFLDNVIDKNDCKKLTDIFFDEKKNMLNTDNGEYNATKYSFGFNPKSYEFNKYLYTLKPIVEEYAGEKHLNIINSYVRCYYNNAELEKHVDRPDIGITLSICLDLNIDKEWPLCAVTDRFKECYHTNVGQGVLLLNSNRFVHWRDKLECNEKSHVLQFFLHWSSKKEEQKENKTII